MRAGVHDPRSSAGTQGARWERMAACFSAPVLLGPWAPPPCIAACTPVACSESAPAPGRATRLEAPPRPAAARRLPPGTGPAQAAWPPRLRGRTDCEELLSGPVARAERPRHTARPARASTPARWRTTSSGDQSRLFVQGQGEVAVTGRECRHVRVAAAGSEDEKQGKGEEAVTHPLQPTLPHASDEAVRAEEDGESSCRLSSPA